MQHRIVRQALQNEVTEMLGTQFQALDAASN
jgi:hypothetical protein